MHFVQHAFNCINAKHKITMYPFHNTKDSPPPPSTVFKAL